MNCDQALEAISAKLDGELDAAQQAALEAHLQSCQACRAVYETLQTVDVILPDTQLEPPKALRDGVMQAIHAEQKKKMSRRWVPVAVIGVAAATALVLGSVGLVEMPGFSAEHRSSASLHEIVDTLFPETQSAEHTSEAAAQYAQEYDCAVLAIWDCGELPELTGECETLSDGGRLYAVDAATLETLLSVYQTEYPMESYAPAGEAVSAAAVLYD